MNEGKVIDELKMDGIDKRTLDRLNQLGGLKEIKYKRK